MITFKKLNPQRQKVAPIQTQSNKLYNRQTKHAKKVLINKDRIHLTGKTKSYEQTKDERERV